MKKYIIRKVLGIADYMRYRGCHTRRTKKTKSHTLPYYLCEDLIEEIIGRLPSKSLLRLRSLSKSWCSRISSPNFIRKQTIRSATKTTQSCLVRQRHHCLKNDYQVVYRLHPKDTYMALESVKFPLKDWHIVGSCYGIICLLSRGDIPSIALWNPSIRRKLIVPNVPLINTAFGFGYDPIIDDFKIVGISVKPAQTSFIYSMKTSSWTEIALPTPLPYKVHTMSIPLCFLKGVLHWVVQDDSDETNRDAYIITFDISSHVFGVISLPKPGYRYTRPTVINGSLAIIAGNTGDRWIWERRDNESWSNPYKFTSSGTEGTDSVVRHNHYLKNPGLSYTVESYSDASYIIDIDFGVESLHLLDGDTS